ncbi:MAG: inner membrane-spanning protein YciB [Caulobacteraceae bacterium]
MAETKAVIAARQTANIGPAAAFLATLLITRDFRTATWVLVGFSAAALALSLAVERRFAPIPTFSAVAALLFGGLSLALRRNDLVQMKMTFVDGLLGAGLFVGLAMKRIPLKALLGHALKLPDRAWRVLTVRYALFFWASAIANEIVRRTQTAEVWATFRIVAVVAALVFGAAQFPFLSRHMQQDEPEEATAKAKAQPPRR